MRDTARTYTFGHDPAWIGTLEQVRPAEKPRTIMRGTS